MIAKFWLLGRCEALIKRTLRPSVPATVLAVVFFWGFGFLAAARAAAPAPAWPSFNPYLAREYNNQSHWNDAATDSTTIAVPRGHYRVTPGSYDWIPGETLGIPAYGARVRGREVVWFFTGTMLRKFIREPSGFREIARRAIRHELPDYAPLTDEQRRVQARDLKSLLEAHDEQGVIDYVARQPNRMASAVEDQVAQGVLYSLLTVDHAFVGANARGLLRIDQEDAANPESGLREPLQVTLPDELFDDAKARKYTIFQTDSVFGLGMSFNGYLVINTVGGVIATLDRRTLKLIDVYRSPGADEVITNSFATSDEAGGGAIYVASNRNMYRFVIDRRGRIRTDERSGAWSAAYDVGMRLPVGKISDGTGATPTLTGFGRGEDKLVVLTDGRRKMRLVAFWRDRIPKNFTPPPGAESPRIADQIEVDLGPQWSTVQSEQSVVAYGPYAFVLNGIPDPAAPPLKVRGSYVRGLLSGYTRPLPRGIAMFRWDSVAHRWQALWHRSDVGTVATVPMISGASRMVIVNGSFGDRPGEMYHLGFDLDDGALVMSIASGADPLFNGAFTGIKCDRDGSLMYTTVLGLVRFEVAKMAPASSPDPQMRKN